MSRLPKDPSKLTSKRKKLEKYSSAHTTKKVLECSMNISNI